MDFYPRSPCGERRITTITTCTASRFLSTLSLRRATNARPDTRRHGAFLSTLSLRRATAGRGVIKMELNNFYPRSPCGERRRKGSRRCVLSSISIHALLAESDRVTQRDDFQQGHFYPRSPCGERPGYQRLCEHPTKDFYPRSPCGERLLSTTALAVLLIFLSTLSLRRATM